MIGNVAGALAVIAMAFAMGFAIRRGSICMVEASRLMVVEGRPTRLAAFACASAVAALAILPLAWGSADPDILARSVPVGPALLIAGCGFGLGAWINGGCAFGTLTRLSGGQSEYIATVLASLAGLMMADPVPAITRAGWFAEPGIAGGVMIVASIILAATMLTRASFRNLRAAVMRDETVLQPVAAMALIGLLSGLLYALAGSWTHLSLLREQTEVLTGQTMNTAPPRAIAGGGALVAGALFAAWRSGRFRWQWPTATGLAMRATGGFLMGFSATHIPGGNGALITYGVPSGSASAWAALAAMTLTLALLFVPSRLKRSRGG